MTSLYRATVFKVSFDFDSHSHIDNWNVKLGCFVLLCNVFNNTTRYRHFITFYNMDLYLLVI